MLSQSLQIGLYLTLEKNGIIKRYIITKSDGQELPAEAIKVEIIEFSEFNCRKGTENY